MNQKQPEECLYEYVVTFEGEEIAVYYSDVVPPEIGSLLNPWEFVSTETKNKMRSTYHGPYRVIEVNQQPKNMDGGVGEVASQTMVNVIVERDPNIKVEKL